MRRTATGLQKNKAAVLFQLPHIERWVEGDDRGDSHGIRLKEEWFFGQSPEIDRLSWFYRWMFRLTGSIQAVQRAQRLLYYTL